VATKATSIPNFLNFQTGSQNVSLFNDLPIRSTSKATHTALTLPQVAVMANCMKIAVHFIC